MTQLKTTFAGLTLQNPIIVSSSGLTNSAESIKSLENAGAGAVVLKSTVEEQIAAQVEATHDYGSSEASHYLHTYIRAHALNKHIDLIKAAKDSCSIPVIASINCYSNNEWIDFASTMEQAGADALEINILSLQTGKDYTYGSLEQRHMDIFRHIKKVVQIPVIIKLGNNFTNPVALINQLQANKAAGIVLFNRFYQPDFNVDKLTITNTNVMSSPTELAERLRWTAIASAQIPTADYAVSGGIHDGQALIKVILAGASAAEICSVIYQKGTKVIKKMKEELVQWMETHRYETITQFKGKLNAATIGDITPFERTQFMKYFSNYEE